MHSAARPPRRFALSAVLIGLLIASLACSGISFLAPTATPTATSTPTPSATFTPSATPTITPSFTPSITPTTSYVDWPVVFTDTFDDENGGWYTGVSTDEYATANISITGGQYLLKVTAIKPFTWRFKAAVAMMTDCYLAVDATQNSGSRDADFGIIFRLSGDDYYYFSINPAYQSYSAMAYIGGEWDNIIEWQKTDVIQTTGVNRIAVLAQEKQFTLFVNGTKVDSFKNNNLEKGRAGLALGLGNTGDYINLAFDNFEVRAPE
jgi:hypothetical protein